MIVGNQVKEAAVQIDRQAERVKDHSVRLGDLLVQRYRRPYAEGSFARDRSRTNPTAQQSHYALGLRARYMQVHAINIVTEDVHARRACLFPQRQSISAGLPAA